MLNCQVKYVCVCMGVCVCVKYIPNTHIYDTIVYLVYQLWLKLLYFKLIRI